MKINEIFGRSKNDPDSWFKKRAKLQGVTQGVAKQWQTLARANNLNLQTTDPAEQQQIKKHLQAVTAQYMSGGEYGNDKTAVVRAVAGIPLPDKLDSSSLNNYFASTTQARYDTLQKLKYALPGTEEPSAQEQPGQPAAQPQPTQSRAPQSAEGPLSGTGVTVVQSSPLVLKYKKHDFQLADNGQWVDIFRGKPVNPALANHLQTQADKL